MATKREGAVTFKGGPVTLVGPEVKVGGKAPDFKCLSGLSPVTLADTPQKARMFSVVPSLDTPVCSMQTKKFEDALKGLGDSVACYTVSLDLPFAQKRFCSAEGVTSMSTLSDVHNHSFGESWGVLIEGLPLALLARAVFVVDKSGTVTHAEYVSEVTNEPNYETAVAALKAAV
jgi:thiol peroxidase